MGHLLQWNQERYYDAAPAYNELWVPVIVAAKISGDVPGAAEGWVVGDVTFTAAAAVTVGVMAAVMVDVDVAVEVGVGVAGEIGIAVAIDAAVAITINLTGEKVMMLPPTLFLYGTKILSGRRGCVPARSSSYMASRNLTRYFTKIRSNDPKYLPELDRISRGLSGARRCAISCTTARGGKKWATLITPRQD